MNKLLKNSNWRISKKKNKKKKFHNPLSARVSVEIKGLHLNRFVKNVLGLAWRVHKKASIIVQYFVSGMQRDIAVLVCIYFQFHHWRDYFDSFLVGHHLAIFWWQAIAAV